MSDFNIACFAALFCCCVGIAGVLWGMGQFADRCWYEDHAKWVGAYMREYQERAIAAEGKLQIWEMDRRKRATNRSNAASHARQCQIAQQKARKAETTQRLERVAARKRGRVA